MTECISPPIQAILFDLDGTLVDSRKDIAVSANVVRQHFGREPLAVDQVVAMIGDGLTMLIRRALSGMDDLSIAKGIEVFRNHYRDHCTIHTCPYPGVEEVLQSCQPLPMAIVTNKPTSFAVQILKALELEDRFVAVVGGDSPELLKPSPTPLTKAMASMKGIKPASVIMVGDSLPDIEAGKNAGTQTCGVTYGMRSREQLAPLDPDHLIDTIRDLLPLLGH